MKPFTTIRWVGVWLGFGHLPSTLSAKFCECKVGGALCEMLGDSLRLSDALLLIKPETTQVEKSEDSSKWGWLFRRVCGRGEAGLFGLKISHSEKSLR